MARGTSRVELIPGGSRPRVYVDGRPLSGPDAQAALERRLPEALEQTLYLLFSPLHGAGIDQWLHQLPVSSAALLVELDTELADLRHTLAEWHPHRCLVEAYSEPATIAAVRQLVARSALRRVRGVGLTGGYRLHRERYDHVTHTAVHEVERFWRNRGTEIRLYRRWVSNLFRNAALAATPIGALRRRIRRRVILLGAGPALDHVLPSLAALPARERETVSVVAIDTALPSLAGWDVVPDLVVAMDGQVANARDLVPWRWRGVPLLADLTTHPSLVRRFPPENRHFFVTPFVRQGLFEDPQLTELFRDLPRVPPRGSVAPAAVSLLGHELGVREILLVGIDFWYRPPATHARESTGFRLLRAASHRLAHRDGWDRTLHRPWTTVRLRDGSQAPGDAVLADQAAQFRAAVAAVTPATVVRHWGNAGLELGTQGLEDGSLAAWLRHGHTGVDGASPPADTAPLAEVEPPQRAREILTGLLERLRIQESQLADPQRPVFLDAGLAFALVDLPQWPLMTLRREWMELHRQRVLRAVRDYRRRLAAVLEH